jgi:cytidine deaminase
VVDHAALVDAATRALANAYAPYSRFGVGAAVLAGGQVFTGANVENASYGLTICAERAAVFAAVAAGHRTIEAAAVVTDTTEPTAPCGACRQVLREFAPNGDPAALVVVSATLGGRQSVHKLSDLLPNDFGPANLGNPVQFT